MVTPSNCPLEHFHKWCSAALATLREAVFWVFGFVLAQAQTAVGMRLRQSLAKQPKILASQRHIISVNALTPGSPAAAGNTRVQRTSSVCGDQAADSLTNNLTPSGLPPMGQNKRFGSGFFVHTPASRGKQNWQNWQTAKLANQQGLKAPGA